MVLVGISLYLPRWKKNIMGKKRTLDPEHEAILATFGDGATSKMEKNKCSAIFSGITRDGKTWRFVLLAYPETGKIKEFRVKLEDMGVTWDCVVYDYLKESIEGPRDDGTIDGYLEDGAFRYHVIAPVLPSGFGFIGDPANYLTISENRFPSISWDESSITVDAKGDAGDSCWALFFTPKKPRKIEIDGEKPDEIVRVNDMTRVKVEFSETGRKTITLGA